MSRDILDRLIDIHEACNRQIRSNKNFDFERFLNDEDIYDAALARITIIGEAIRNLPQAFKDKYPEIAWQLIADMRNYLVHRYFEVDDDVLWDTIYSHIPQLAVQIEKIIIDLKQSSDSD